MNTLKGLGAWFVGVLLFGFSVFQLNLAWQGVPISMGKAGSVEYHQSPFVFCLLIVLHVTVVIGFPLGVYAKYRSDRRARKDKESPSDY